MAIVKATNHVEQPPKERHLRSQFPFVSLFLFQSVIHVVRSIHFFFNMGFLEFSVFFKGNWFEGYLVVG